MALTPEQQNVFDWLNTKLDLPVYAEAYKGALLLLNTKPPGYIMFVAHTGRELMNGLASTDAGVPRKQVQYQQHVDELQCVWEDKWGGPGLKAHEDTEAGHLIPYPTCQLVKDLIDEHKAGRERSNQADSIFFSTFLDYTARAKVPANFLQEWKISKDWFNGHAHFRKDPFRENVSSEVARHFRTLDGLLYVAASSEFERLKGIDEVLEEANG